MMIVSYDHDNQRCDGSRQGLSCAPLSIKYDNACIETLKFISIPHVHELHQLLLAHATAQLAYENIPELIEGPSVVCTCTCNAINGRHY